MYYEGARDIGRAISEELASQGAKVVVNYFNTPADGEATVAAIKASREIFRVEVEGRSGRIVNTPGDSILAEFVTRSSANQGSDQV